MVDRLVDLDFLLSVDDEVWLESRCLEDRSRCLPGADSLALRDVGLSDADDSESVIGALRVRAILLIHVLNFASLPLVVVSLSF